jgi:hypothetical protein
MLQRIGQLIGKARTRVLRRWIYEPLATGCHVPAVR